MAQSLSRVSSLYLNHKIFSMIPLSLSKFTFYINPTSHLNRQRFSASLSTQKTASLIDYSVNKWRPMCLYFTQGKCTKVCAPRYDKFVKLYWGFPKVSFFQAMNCVCSILKLDDASHVEKFNHNCCRDLDISSEVYKVISAQKLDYFLVLDLEGKVEILEFPVLMVDAKTLAVVSVFHRFVRPSVMSEQRINKYIEGKYGKIGVDRVWHDTAIPFDEVISHFEAWMDEHRLWDKGSSGCLIKAAFVTCGNWDLKTKVPQQCKVSKMNLPSYFMEWINLKDVYLNFYKRRATGMVTMMRELDIPLIGSHHLGIDDTKNITRVVQRMLTDGAILQITARRSPDNLESVEFLFKNRIR